MSDTARQQEMIARFRATNSVKWNSFPDALGAWVAESDLGTAPAVTEALLDAVEHRSLGYLGGVVTGPAREAAAAWQKDAYGWEVTAGDVLLVGDVITALASVVDRMLPAGQPIVLPSPNYMPFFGIPAALGRELITVPSHCTDGHWTLDIDGIEQALAPRGGLLILTNPWNPVGRVLTRAELEQIAAVAERTNALVFADEIHSPILMPGFSHTPLASISPEAAARTVTATSASKAWNLAGLKCAQLILPDASLRARWKALSLVTTHPSTPGVYATTAAYAHGRDWLRDSLATIATNRDRFAAAISAIFPGATHRPAEGTYLAWVDLGSMSDADEELRTNPGAALLSRAGVAVTNGRDCGHPTAFRFNLATTPEVLDAMLDALTSAYGH